MKQLDRYIAGHVLLFSAIVAVALIALQSFITLVAEADDLSEHFGLWQLAQVVLFQMPGILLLLLPMIALIGTLLGLGALAQQGELVAMRAAGVSLLRIGGATLTAGVVLAALALLLSDVVAPAGERAAERLKSEARYGTDPGELIRPVWLRNGAQYYHVRRLVSPHEVAAVTVYTVAEGQRLETLSEVARARFDGSAWLAEDVVQTEFSDAGVREVALPTLRWEQGPTPDVLELIMLEADALSVRGLLRLIAYQDANGLDAQLQRLSLWRKLVAPLTVLVMMLLAIPYVIGSLRDSGTGQRLLVGVLLGVGFWVLNEIVSNSALIYRWPPSMAAVVPSAVVLVLALWRLTRLRA